MNVDNTAPISNLLANKTAVITGTNRGIGKQILINFVEQGATVFANARLEHSLDDLADSLNSSNSGTCIPQYYDITDSAAIKNAFAQIKQKSETLDILVNNAALTENSLLRMIKKQTLIDLFNVNVFAVIEMVQRASQLMKSGGSVINFSSIVAQRGNAGQIAYSASKGAVISLTLSLAKELAPQNIRVNAIAPGLTDTDALDLVSQESIKKRIDGIGLGRLAQPNDIANACLFLASELSTYVTGEVVGVNGGSIL
ncbi:3-oxoacyl-ACP reductase [Actinomycetota bacterium]|nr:3-oxoacyl-ACP reductase [Actinomycetota bacterium]